MAGEAGNAEEAKGALAGALGMSEQSLQKPAQDAASKAGFCKGSECTDAEMRPLYTSEAADELARLDPGGNLIIAHNETQHVSVITTPAVITFVPVSLLALPLCH